MMKGNRLGYGDYTPERNRPKPEVPKPAEDVSPLSEGEYQSLVHKLEVAADNEVVQFFKDGSAQAGKIAGDRPIDPSVKQELAYESQLAKQAGLHFKHDIAPGSIEIISDSSFDARMMRKRLEEILLPLHTRMLAGEAVALEEIDIPVESLHLGLTTKEKTERQHRMTGLQQELTAIRAQKGEPAMVKRLLQRLYNDTQYDYRENAALQVFAEQPVGNCQATAKVAAATLERLGYDPKDDIALQYYRDHVRCVARMGGQWQALEGTRPEPLTNTVGTEIVSLDTVKRALVGLLPTDDQRPIQFGQESVSKGSDAQSVLDWIRKKVDKVTGGHRYPNIPMPLDMDTLHNSMPGGQIISLLRTYSPSQGTIRRVSQMLAAGMFLYGVHRVDDPKVDSIESLVAAAREDVQHLQDEAEAVVQDVTFALKQVFAQDKVAEAAPEKLPATMEVFMVDDAIVEKAEDQLAVTLGMADMQGSLSGGKIESWDRNMNSVVSQVTITLAPEIQTVSSKALVHILEQSVKEIFSNPVVVRKELRIRLIGENIQLSPEDVMFAKEDSNINVYSYPEIQISVVTGNYENSSELFVFTIKAKDIAG